MAIATQGRHAGVNYINETPWVLARRLQWLWVRVSDLAALSMLHLYRSKEAFAALIDNGAGLLGGEGYGVYEHRAHAQQTCLAHLIRSARG